MKQSTEPEFFNFELNSDGISIKSSVSKDFYLTLSNLEISQKEMGELLKLKIALDFLLLDSVEKKEVLLKSKTKSLF